MKWETDWEGISRLIIVTMVRPSHFNFRNPEDGQNMYKHEQIIQMEQHILFVWLFIYNYFQDINIDKDIKIIFSEKNYNFTIIFYEKTRFMPNKLLDYSFYLPLYYITINHNYYLFSIF